MKKYHDYLKPDSFYHIYNRAIGSENLFREDRNYIFFLERWDKYLTKYVENWAYCLMPNHFHFLIKINNQSSFDENLDINKLLEGQFRKLFSSYTLSYNKVYKRSGSLFQKSFKRVEVNSEKYLLTLIHYIHHNPIHHNFVNKYEDWRYSSFSTIINSGFTKIARNKVLKIFGTRERFIASHEEIKNYNKINHLTVE